MTRSGDWMATFSGGKFWPLDPRSEDVRIEDIAHGLSLQPRFAGQTAAFYSVAQHSVEVSLRCDHLDALWGLLHDASEAYLSDLVSPLKHGRDLTGYRMAESRVMDAVREAFGLVGPEPESVYRADRAVLRDEQLHVMRMPSDWAPDPPDPEYGTRGGGLLSACWPHLVAERLFLLRFRALAPGQLAPTEDEIDEATPWIVGDHP